MMSQARWLLCTNHLMGFSGSEVVTFELAEELLRRDCRVWIFARSRDQAFIEQAAPKEAVILTNEAQIDISDYDVIYCQHQTVSLFLADQDAHLLESERRPLFIYNHLSPTELLEAPSPFVEERYADVILANSPETREALVHFGGPFQEVTLFQNPAPDRFDGAKRDLPPSPKRLLSVSNHLPEELREAFEILREDGIEVSCIGHATEQRWLERQDMLSHDGIVTIGKTVQYAIRSRTPVFCYDRFGGPGWITAENIDAAEAVNFSGRCQQTSRTPRELAFDLIESYQNALVVDVVPTRFILEAALDGVLEELELRRYRQRAAPLERDDLKAQLNREKSVYSLVQKYYQSSEVGRAKNAALNQRLRDLQKQAQVVPKQTEALARIADQVGKIEKLQQKVQLIEGRTKKLDEITRKSDSAVTRLGEEQAKWRVHSKHFALLRKEVDKLREQGKNSEEILERKIRQARDAVEIATAKTGNLVADVSAQKSALVESEDRLAKLQKNHMSLLGDVRVLSIRKNTGLSIGSTLKALRHPRSYWSLRRDQQLLAGSKEFDKRWYLASYGDVAQARIDPVQHFCAFGWKEGRDPSPDFSTSYYLATHKDVTEQGLNPLSHYILHGKSEGREIMSRADFQTSERPEAAKIVENSAPKEKLAVDKVVKPNAVSFQPSEQRSTAPTTFEEIAPIPAPQFIPRRQRIAVYTAIVDGYDRLKFPEIVEPGIDYICLTDTSIPDPGIWQVWALDYFNPDPTRVARFVKTHPHIYLADYDRSIWIDANLLIRGELYEWAHKCLSQDPFHAFQHPHRNCIYDEADEILARGGLDNTQLVLDQVERLKDAGYPEGRGLTETNVIMRQHNIPEVKALNNDWWNEIVNGSKRDQLSLDFVAWKHSFNIKPLAPKGISVRNSPKFSRVRHLKDGDEYSPGDQATANAAQRPRPTNKIAHPHHLDRPTARKRARSRTIDVVICIHNSPDDVELCIDSVNRHRADNQRIVLVDDGSEAATRAIIDAHMALNPQDMLVRHETARGYTKAANAGLRASTADYVALLNSDTIVPSGWAGDLIACAEQLPEIGIVGPLSNAASWQSIPRVLAADGDLAVNDLPDGMSVDDVSRLCATLSDGRPLLGPLVNGFCFLIKRAVIDKIGYLDEKSFPMGYGEENDFCLRAGDAGFVCAIASDCYVFHAKSKSFSHERRKDLSKIGSQAFRSKYVKSRVDNSILLMKAHPGLNAMREAFDAFLAAKPSSRQPEPANFPADLVLRDTRRGPPAQKLPPNRFLKSMDADRKALAANAANVARFRDNPTTELKSVTWFIPNTNHIYRGGIFTIFRIADSFSRFGGTFNRFVIMGPDANLEQIGRDLETEFPSLQFELEWIKTPEEAKALPRTDAGFCTLWTTAFALLNFNQCDAKYYLIQDFEPAFFAAGSLSALIEQTYRFGFTGICNTSGVADRYKYYTDWLSYFTPAVDKTRFYLPDNFAKPAETQIVFYGRPANDRNAFLLGVEALRRVKEELRDDISIVSAGHEFKESDYGLEKVLRNLGLLPDIDSVARLYQESHLGLVFMYTPHPSYQPFEFMACGCATVTNFNEGTSWFLKDGKNALLFESTVSAAAERIIEGAGDPALRDKVIKGGLATVAGLDWERELRKIYEYVRNPVPTGRKVEKKSGILHEA